MCRIYSRFFFFEARPVCPTYELIRYIKYNNPQSAYALNIIQNVHEHGPIQDTMTFYNKPIKMYK